MASAAWDTKRDVQVLLRDAALTRGVMRLLKAHGVKPDPGIAGQGPDERTEADSGKAGRDWRDAPRRGGRRRRQHDPGWQASVLADALSDEPMEKKDRRSQSCDLGFPLEKKGKVFPGAQAGERSERHHEKG